jgi:hypothetical protein
LRRQVGGAGLGDELGEAAGNAHRGGSRGGIGAAILTLIPRNGLLARRCDEYAPAKSATMRAGSL